MAKTAIKPKKDVSKVNAVRQALSKLGNDATPTEIQGFVKKTHGLDMTAAHVSNCKSTILKEAAGRSGRAMIESCG